ncbi:DNA polymerase [Noviherbaspirillum sp. 1P10PC]|uniref:DNA polymerase n=1 Tax=Noviherbaspirillum sp. 1P10PC TaxID=3132292 RepID=UPI0039A022AB
MESSIAETCLNSCDFEAGAYIQQSDSALPFANDAIPSITVPDIDAEVAKLEAQLKRQLDLYEIDPTKPFVNHAGPRVLIGFDSEFTFNPLTGENDVLSLQFHLIGDEGEWPRTVYPKSSSKGARPNLQRLLLNVILKALDMGVISEWPSSVTLAGFFLRLDLAAFSDFAHFKTELDSAGGKVATIGQGVDFTYERTGASIPFKKTSVIRDGVGLFVLKTKFIDLGRHVVEGVTLDRIGSWLGLPKLELPEGYSKSRMDILLKENKAAFEEYAMRDAEITVRFLQHLEAFAITEVGCEALPATVSSLAVTLLKKVLKEDGIDFNAAWGMQTMRSAAWNDRKGKVCSKVDTVPCPERQIVDPFVIMTYHGGRNECFHMGPTHVSDWFDYDLAGAYTTGLTDLGTIDYSGMRFTIDPHDFVGHVLGFARVKFQFPADCRFPSLPVEVGIKGLYFPLAGESYCTAPEIEVALNQGCKIEILHGVIFPWADANVRLFQPFVTRVRELRARYKKERTDPAVATLPEEYAKLIGNSAYGKLAQGLKEKTVFDTRGMESVKLPPSSITNAIMASHATGFVRAVMAELLTGVPGGFTVVSVTTDGFLTDAPVGSVNCSGPMARRFQALCERVAPGTKMLECKHRARQVIGMKTRGQATAERWIDEYGDPTPAMTAKAGVSPPVPKSEHNDYLINLYLNRQPGQKTTTRPFTSLREQWLRDIDVTKTEREMSLNLEFDFKRRLVNPRMVQVAGGEHLACNSVPWADAATGERARAYFDGWRRKHCLKTLTDLAAWQAHYEFSIARARRVGGRSTHQKRAINMTKEGPLGVMKRLFLRAFAQKRLGVTGEIEKVTHQEMADWLTSLGYPTTKSAVSNAVRETLVEHTVPVTEEVKAFIEKVQSRFPTMEVGRFLISTSEQV